MVEKTHKDAAECWWKWNLLATIRILKNWDDACMMGDMNDMNRRQNAMNALQPEA